jgi:hypothetical protein
MPLCSAAVPQVSTNNYSRKWRLMSQGNVSCGVILSSLLSVMKTLVIYNFPQESRFKFGTCLYELRVWLNCSDSLTLSYASAVEVTTGDVIAMRAVTLMMETVGTYEDGQFLRDYTAQHRRRQVITVLSSVRTWDLTKWRIGKDLVGDGRGPVNVHAVPTLA